MPTPIRIISDPGIKRDGTLLEGSNYVDGQWCRWHRGLPKKMNGYRNVVSTSSEKFYGMNAFARNAQEYLHLGSASKVLQYTLDYNAIFQTASDRTPGAGFLPSVNNLWQMVVMFDAISGNSRIIAHPGQNLAFIDSSVETSLFYGDTTATAALTKVATASDVSGGITYVAPYLFKYGNDGRVQWSVINNPNDWATGLGTAGGPGDARITGSKIIKGMPLRGGGGGPAAIFWSLDSLLRGSFVQGFAGTFAFDTLDDEISVLSSSAIVEADGIYYWPAVDRFQMFNGVVQELPNEMNLDYFYDNINLQWRQKCFAVKVPRWGEIWWCYPRGSATECTHAVIYNYRRKTWYDTALPSRDGGRTTGTFAKVYEHPFMTGAAPDAAGKYRVWKHEETTKNEIDGTAVNSIPSYFETNEISMLTQEQAQDKSTRVVRVEPDFVQSGDMVMTVRGRANARAKDIVSADFTFSDDATADPEQQTVDVKEVRRLMRFRFASNVIDGDYEMGQTLAHVEPADGRVRD